MVTLYFIFHQIILIFFSAEVWWRTKRTISWSSYPTAKMIQFCARKFASIALNSAKRSLSEMNYSDT